MADAAPGVQVAGTVSAMPTTPPDRPRLSELLRGAFTGLSIHPRAATLGVARSVGLIGLMTLVLALAVGVSWTVRLKAKVESMADSSIWFMPRVNIANGVAQVEADPGRVIETDRVVIVFDTVSEQPEIPRGIGEDARPRVLVREHAMLLFTAERPLPTALPWAQVNEAVGSVSVDGPELIASLRAFVPRMVATLGAIGAAAALVWQLVLAGGFVGVYRTVFGRGLYVPGPGALFGVAAVATIPPLSAAAVLLAIGRQELAVAVHGVGFGALFLLGATRVRLGDERPGAAVPEDSAALPDPVDAPAAVEEPSAPRPVVTEL